MCTAHSMLRKNSNIGLIHANTAAYMIRYCGCVQMHILQWQMTYEPQQECFIKMAVLHCISISEICSAINSTVATLHENFTSRQNSLTAGPRYIRGCCLTLERRYGFRAGA